MNTIPGWKLVPVEPDAVMVDTLQHYLDGTPKTALREAILAAPVPPEQQSPAPGLVEAVRALLKVDGGPGVPYDASEYHKWRAAVAAHLATCEQKGGQ